MRFVVDVCLSRQVAGSLTKAGWDAVHWRDIGDPKAFCGPYNSPSTERPLTGTDGARHSSTMHAVQRQSS